MKAVVYEGPQTFGVVELPDPEVGPGEVRLRVDQAGVCGTDRHIHEGGFGATFPLTPGHEVVGTVDALGDGVHGLEVGEQVTVNPNVQCGRCSYCRSGRPILCEDLQAYGVTMPGFFAELATVPAATVFSVEGLHRDLAVFTEPAACATHGLETLAPRPGSSVLVLGSGATGLLLAQLIGHGGAASVTVASPEPAQLSTARALGVDRTVEISKSDADANVTKLLELSHGRDGFDYVVEATGVPVVGGTTLQLVRRGGTVLVYGVNPADATLPYRPYDVYRRELTIKGSFAEITSFDAAIAALRHGRVRTDGIITHRFPLEEYGAALAALQGGAGVHKVVVDLSS